MAIRNGLLALLERGPKYGYQLRSEFEASTGSTWPLNIGQVYTTLARLERDGLVEPAGDGEDESRVTYRLTAAGHEEVRRWFSTPVERRSRPRDELAIKLALALTTPGVDVHAVVQAQRTATLRALQDLTRLKVRADEVDRRGLAARPRVDDLPGGGRGPLARPLRDAHRRPPRRSAGRDARPVHHARPGDDPMIEYVLELRDLVRVHGHGAAEVHALRGIELGVLPGELVAVMGPSGSGKSTLLNLAGGLDTPTSGTVLVEGVDLAGLSRAELAAVRRRSVGYVFQDFNLIPALTAAENVALPRELDGMRGRDARREALAALEEVELADVARPLPGRAVRRPAPARGDRPRARRPAAARARRRADRRARQPHGRVGSAAAARTLRRRRLRRARHARGAARRLGRPRGVPARRRDGRRDRARHAGRGAARRPRVSGWRPALRIARRTVRRSPGRSLLVAVLIAVPVAGATMVDVVARSLGDGERSASRIMGAADAVLVVTRWDDLPGYSPVNGIEGGGPRDRNPRSVDVAALVPRGTRLVPAPRTHDLRLKAGRRGAATSAVVADLREPLLAHKGELLAGRAPRDGELLVSSALADRLDVGPGDVVQIAGGPPATVSGLAREPMCHSCEQVIAAPGSDLARRIEATDGYTMFPVTGPGYLVDLPAGADAEALWPELAAQGVALIPRTAFSDPERYLGGGGAGPASIETLRTAALVTLIAGLGILEVVLLAGAAFAVGARRQTRELGLVGAAGGSAGHVRRIVLAQGLVLGVLGAALGVAFGLVAAVGGEPLWASLDDADIPRWELRPLEIAGAGLLGVLAGLAAALVPAIGAGRMTPVDALAERVRRSRRARRRSGALGGALLAAGALTGLAGQQLLADDFAAYRAALDRLQDGGMFVSAPSPTGPVGLVLLGAVLAVAGIVLVAPALIGALARAGGRLPVAARLAVRDAARHRHRTGPATSAVTVAVAGSIVLAFTLAGTFRADELQHVPQLPAGVMSIETGDAEPAARAAAAERAATLLPDGRVVRASTPLGPLPPDGPGSQGLSDTELRLLYPVPEACGENDCAGGGGPLVLAGDPAVEEITAGGPLDAEQRAALAAGKAVVFDPALPDAQGRLRIDDARGESVWIPALLTERERPLFGLPSALLAPAAAREHGWEAAPERVMLTYDPAATEAQLDEAAQAADDVGAYAVIERGAQEEADAILLIAAGAAAFVTLLGVAISVALSAAEGRADLATLAAVGAPPRRRRALAAGQALLIAGLGCGLGLLLGAFVAFTARATTGSPQFVVPWANVLITGVAVPILAVLVAALFTPSRLPLARRAT